MKMSELRTDLVHPEMLCEFVTSHGWNIKKNYENGISVWMDKSDGNPIWVPLDKSYTDYHKAITNVIETISKATKSPVEDLVDELSQKYNDKDLIEFRLVSEDSEKGNLPLQEGPNTFQAIFDILKATVKASDNIKDAFKEIFLEQALLSQTKHGSYIVSLYTPVLFSKDPDESKQSELSRPKMFGREINNNLFKRLKLLKSIVGDFHEEQLPQSLAILIKNGFKKSEIEAIDKLFGSQGQRDWEVKILRAGKEYDEPVTKLTFNHTQHNPVKRILAELNSVEEKTARITLLGRIIGTVRDYDEDIGTCKLRALYKGGKEVTITLHLEEHLYKVAQEANATKQTVSVTGKMIETKMGRRKSYFMPEVTAISEVNTELDLDLD